MNRGKNKRFVTLMLIGLAVVAALIVDAIGGTTGDASTPAPTSSTSARLGNTSASGRVTGSPSGASGNYKTVGTFVNLRAGAGTDAAIITVMSQIGTPVQLSCYLRGTSVAGDPWWYRATFINAHGYVAGYWVDTGPDPAKTHLPAC